jgi:hypothetical protein
MRFWLGIRGGAPGTRRGQMPSTARVYNIPLGLDRVRVLREADRARAVQVIPAGSVGTETQNAIHMTLCRIGGCIECYRRKGRLLMQWRTEWLLGRV